MKKLLLGLLLFSISLLGYTENTVEQIKTTAKDATESLKQATSEINPTVVYFTEKLQELAKSLKVPAEHVYGVLIKQQIAMAYLWLSLFFISIICGARAVISIPKSTWGDVSYYDSEDKASSYWKGHAWNKHATFIIVFGFLALCSFIPALCNIRNMFTGLFNPEYGALKEIMELF